MRASQRKKEKAVVAREVHGKVGFISDAKFKRLLNSGSIKNCSVRAKDVDNAIVIFGPNRDMLGWGQQLESAPEE